MHFDGLQVCLFPAKQFESVSAIAMFQQLSRGGRRPAEDEGLPVSIIHLRNAVARIGSVRLTAEEVAVFRKNIEPINLIGEHDRPTRASEGKPVKYVGINPRNRTHLYYSTVKRCRDCSQKSHCTRGKYRMLGTHTCEPARHAWRDTTGLSAGAYSRDCSFSQRRRPCAVVGRSDARPVSTVGRTVAGLRNAVHGRTAHPGAYDKELVPDALRTEFCVSSLAGQKQNIQAMQQQKDWPFPDWCR